MALQSNLFKDDPVFEACLTRDSAHVVPGARGFHVSKIQYALMVLDSYLPAKSELDTGTYGRSTAEGVLAFKRKRNIINFSYQRTADNIVGKMTIAALDAEMFRLESRFLTSRPARR